MARDDVFLESKHADISLTRGSGEWSYWFLDQPKKGKCLSIEFIERNYPRLVVEISSNTKAKQQIANAKRVGFEERRPA